MIEIRRGKEGVPYFGRWLDNRRDAQDSYEYRRMEADYSFCCSRAERLLGQSYLARHPHTASQFDDIVSTFLNAHSLMQKSADKMQQIGEPFAEQEIHQLDYLIEVCRSRRAVLVHDFDGALSPLPRAREHAEAGRVGFPNYYENIEALENERYFIEAFRALVNNEIEKARESIRTWFNGESVTEGTMRWQLVRIRQLALDFLAGEHEAIEDLRTIIKVPRYGATSRFIRDTLEAAANGNLSTAQALENLIKVFPLDTVPPPEWQDTRLHSGPSIDELLLLMPRFFSDALGTKVPPSQTVGQLYYLWFVYIRMVTECLCGIYGVKLRRNEISERVSIPTDLRLLPLAKMAELLEALGRAMDWKGTEISEAIKWIQMIQRFSSFSNEATGTLTNELKDILLGTVRSTVRGLFPCPVKVQSQTVRPDGSVSLLLERGWCLPNKHLEIICIERKDLELGQWYFLKPSLKERLGSLYHEKATEIYNFYPASTFEFPRRGPFLLLVEGKHDAAAIRNLLNHFAPHWSTQIRLQYGDGSEVQDEYKRARTRGDVVVTVADGDKRGVWTWPDIYYLDPDFEGLDDEALSSAINEGWGQEGIHINVEEIRNAKALPRRKGGTVEQLGRYLKDKIGLLRWDVGEAKERLAALIPKRWAAENRLPEAIKAPIGRMLELAFGPPERDET